MKFIFKIVIIIVVVLYLLQLIGQHIFVTIRHEHKEERRHIEVSASLPFLQGSSVEDSEPLLQKPSKLILFGSDWWWMPYPYLDEISKQCPQCQFTDDSRLYEESDAVLFHGITLPKYPPRRGRRPAGQIWVWFILEAPSHLENRHKRATHYNNVFNWTMTYRRDSDVVVPYGRVIPIKNIPRPDFSEKWAFLPNDKTLSNDLYEKSLMGIPTLEELKNKKMVAWIATNCRTASKREEGVFELDKYIQVDIYGPCGSNQCKLNRNDRTSSGNMGINCRLDISKKYKFYLAFENSLCEDYVTEKYFDTVLTQMVPIVYGAINYSLIAPESSYIDVANFKSVKSLAKYLIFLDRNPKEYLKYFEWRKLFWVQNNGFVTGFCDLCQKLWTTNGSMTKYYENVNDWWFRRSDYNEKTNPAMACVIPRKFNSTKKVQTFSSGLDYISWKYE